MPQNPSFQQNYKQAKYAVVQARQAVQQGEYQTLERYKTHLEIIKTQLHKQLQDQPAKVIDMEHEEHQQALKDIAQAEQAIQQAMEMNQFQ